MSLNENEVYEIQVYTRKYRIGTCFACQKCLYCGKDLTFENCHCNKYEKPTKNNRTAKVRGYRGLCYDASNAQPFLKEFMKKSNLKFGYEVNLATSFYCSLCTACNSKISRENNKFGKEIKKEKDIIKSEVNQVIELQLRISIKNEKEILPSILVNWSFDDIKYNDLSTKIEQLVSEHIGLTFSNEYFLAYKGSSEVGAGTLLDNEITFEEFLKDYKQVTSEETEEEAPKSKSVKTKKKGTAMNRVPKESKLDEKEKMIGEIMMQLKDKYVCNHYNHKHCFVKDGRHLFLSNVSFSMWAQDIFKNNTDFETPPNHAIFSMLHSVKPTSYNSNNKNSLTIPNVIQEEEIRVNQLFKLSDAEYNLIGISKIGIRQTLRDESKKFE
ncbi:uncharacterized protein OCT59_013867 [Rhizophagus irregularis]|nr:hypothetical protein OCT59_013867 [Rhizophagus irregularis]GBC23272.1 hypothetical protein GLOIN_2v1792087 [Rhizophagus irregularis DAOM 181602=DAOM 197198]